jgi:hypothetical protein
VRIIIAVSWGSAFKRKREPATCVTEYRFKDDTATVIAIGHNFVTGNKGEGNPIVKVC